MLSQQQEQRQKAESRQQEIQVLCERLDRQLDFEKTCRAEDQQRSEAEIKDLQEQIGEYEEETMNLQHQIYELKQIQALEQRNSQMEQHSPTKSQRSQKQQSPERYENKKELSAIQEPDSISQLSTTEIAEKKKFREVFGESNEEADKRITTLEDKLKVEKMKNRREEEARKTYAEAARKKDEELKVQKTEIQLLEKKLKEEISTKQREKTLIMQRDNKISVLEQKLAEFMEGNGKASKLKTGSGLHQKEATPTRQSKGPVVPAKSKQKEISSG